MTDLAVRVVRAPRGTPVPDDFEAVRGFERAPVAPVNLFEGRNLGRQLVQFGPAGPSTMTEVS